MPDVSDKGAAVQEQITAYWDTSGTNYDTAPGHGILHEREQAVWLSTLRELLPPPPADVLDVGTGTGVLALLLAQLGYQVIGVDLAEGMLATARAKTEAFDSKPSFQIGDAVDPPGAPASFDIVSNRHLLWTLVDPARGFRNWFRLLRPGGRLLAIDGLWPAEQQKQELAEGHSSSHPGYSEAMTASLPLRGITSVEPVIDMARAAGFADIRVEYLEEIARVEQEVLPASEHHFRARYAVLAIRP